MNDTNIEYWLFLQSVIGFGNNKILDITTQYQNIRDFYDEDVKYLLNVGLLNKEQAKRFKYVSLDSIYQTMEICDKLGHHIITPDDKRYPERLVNIIDPPAALFVKGEFINTDDYIAISIVGARKATRFGKDVARELAYNLTKCGCLIVSGGAKGIDFSAHTGALRAGGKTIAFLPCGLNYSYLPDNAELRDEISQNGCLISEMPPNAPLFKNSFRVRNRLISAFGLGTVVVEGNIRSGASITANHALEQGKDIFAVPGEADNPYSYLPNKLIGLGAIPVTKTTDILNEYNSIYPNKLIYDLNYQNFIGSPESVYDQEIQSAKNETNADVNLSDNAKTMLDAFVDAEEYSDDLIIRSGLDYDIAIQTFSELEVANIIEAVPGGRYVIIENKRRH